MLDPAGELIEHMMASPPGSVHNQRCHDASLPISGTVQGSTVVTGVGQQQHWLCALAWNKRRSPMHGLNSPHLRPTINSWLPIKNKQCVTWNGCTLTMIYIISFYFKKRETCMGGVSW